MYSVKLDGGEVCAERGVGAPVEERGGDGEADDAAEDANLRDGTLGCGCGSWGVSLGKGREGKGRVMARRCENEDGRRT